MLRTIFFFLILWISLILSLLLFIPLAFLLLFANQARRTKYVHWCVSGWASMTLLTAGCKLKVTGQENIPEKPDYIILSNHQGNLDVPVLLKIFPHPPAFVAKRELLYVPFINVWLLALQCILIRRENKLESYYRIKKALNRNSGRPILLFPEGTRSRGSEKGLERKGGLYIAGQSRKPLVKVRIEGTWKAWEGQKRIRPSEVSITISPG